MSLTYNDVFGEEYYEKPDGWPCWSIRYCVPNVCDWDGDRFEIGQEKEILEKLNYIKTHKSEIIDDVGNDDDEDINVTLYYETNEYHETIVYELCIYEAKKEEEEEEEEEDK